VASSIVAGSPFSSKCVQPLGQMGLVRKVCDQKKKPIDAVLLEATFSLLSRLVVFLRIRLQHRAAQANLRCLRQDPLLLLSLDRRIGCPVSRVNCSATRNDPRTSTTRRSAAIPGNRKQTSQSARYSVAIGELNKRAKGWTHTTGPGTPAESSTTVHNHATVGRKMA
jgi:hypothetical protein